MSTRCVVLMLSVLVWACVVSTARPNGTVFPKATLERALENGCSLVIAEVLEVYTRDRMYYYKPRIVRTIVAGDLEKGEVHNPPDLFAGASYGAALKPGSFYTIFIERDYPHEFGWAFRDDVIEVNPSDEETIRRLVETADRVYAATSIRQFRRTRSWAYVKPPDLPDELALLCKQFRERPGRRTELGKRMAESDLGSQRDGSDILSSIIRYLPPKISLSRQQVLSLLGEPRWRSGWTYSWSCDHYVSAQEGGEQIGMLSVTFDRNERATRVLFDMQERSKWIRPSRPDDWFAALDGDPGAVARGFLQALRGSNWEQALSFCSPSVEAKARQLDSTEAFFRRFMPVEKLTALWQFDPHGFGSRDGRVVNVSSEVHIDTAKARWPVRWNWALVRSGAAWLVDFELVPLEDFIQKELIKSEMINDSAARRRWESHEGIRYVLTPATAEFMLGQPMLLRLEMRNEGTEPVGYMRTSVMLNDPLLVTGPDGQTLPYMDTSYQTMVGSDAILPGEVIVLADAYDVASQYGIVRPGRYTFQFRSTHLGGKPSNICEVDVKPGPLPDVETIVERLLPILPAGWRFTRYMALQNDNDPRSSGQLYVHMSGKPGGKGNRYGLTLVVLMGDDPLDADPWLKEWADFWGSSRWGPVYAHVNEVESLWPTYRADITRALGIESPGTRAIRRR